MNDLKDIIFQKLDVSKADILKEVPNLKPEHYFSLVNLVMHACGASAPYCSIPNDLFLRDTLLSA